MATPRAPRTRRAGPRAHGDVASSILGAAERLLGQRGLRELTVADVIEAAGVSRGSFYFYFESKEAVAAALLERIVDEIHEASLPWLERGNTEPEAALRKAITGSLTLWRRHAAVLQATVESWQSDTEIRELWGRVLERFTTAAAAQIERDREAGLAPPGLPSEALAGALVAMNERCFYFALVDSEPGADARLVEALTSIWLSSLYGRRLGEAG
jgi:TetR/AcrR family transcriptional regulator, ethionamide resistance regulator